MSLNSFGLVRSAGPTTSPERDGRRAARRAGPADAGVVLPMVRCAWPAPASRLLGFALASQKLG